MAPARTTTLMTGVARVPAYQDNKLIDLIAAVISSLAVSYRRQWGISLTTPTWNSLNDFTSTAIYIVAYALAALLVFRWNTVFRVRFGWIFIAVIGSVVSAVLNELIFKSTGQDEFFRGASFFPIVLMLYLFISLAVMAIFHYLGLVVSSVLKSHKAPPNG